jgi:PilZ domain-containing protein
MKGSDRYRLAGVSCRVGEHVWRVVNLSVGGFFVEAREPLPRGQTAHFELALPGGRSVAMTGLVTWVNEPSAPIKPETPAGFGVKIHRIAFPDKMTLLTVLREATPASMRAR